jgi:hypothetical protein
MFCIRHDKHMHVSVCIYMYIYTTFNLVDPVVFAARSVHIHARTDIQSSCNLVRLLRQARLFFRLDIEILGKIVALEHSKFQSGGFVVEIGVGCMHLCVCISVCVCMSIYLHIECIHPCSYIGFEHSNLQLREFTAEISYG